LEHVFEVVIVSFFAVVNPSEDGVTEVDADLGWPVSWRRQRGRVRVGR